MELKNRKSFPNDWIKICMGQLGETYGGLTGKNKDNFGKGDCYYIPYVNVYRNFKINPLNFEKVEVLPTEKQNRVMYGDILFTTSSETPNEIGMSSVLLNKIDNLYLNSFCFGFRPNLNVINPNYAAYYFRDNIFRKEIFKLAQGSTRFNMSKTALMKLEIIIPSTIKEQQKIAEILSTVDEQIENIEQLIEKTKELKKGLMQQLLTKGIGHTEFKQTELGEIPIEWEIKKFEEVFSLIDGDRSSKYPGPKDIVDSGIMFLSTSNIVNNKLNLEYIRFITEEKFKTLSKGHLLKNDLIITLRGTLGSVALFNARNYETAFINAQMMILRCSHVINPLYAYYSLISSKTKVQIRRTVSGSAQPQLTKGDLKNFIIAWPPINEQQKIASILLSVDEQIESYEQEKAKYLELKKGFMQQLLTGKMRVTV